MDAASSLPHDQQRARKAHILSARTLYTNIGPVTGIEIYKQDTVVVRSGTAPSNDIPERSEITMFSKKSRRRLAFVASNTDVVFRTMLTLTYPLEYPSDGKTVKKHFHAFLSWLRRDTGGTSYLWFLEFQKRGAPHFHILISMPMPSSVADRSAFRLRMSWTWYRLVGSGDLKHFAAGCRAARIRNKEGARNYTVKYAWKMKQKTIPKEYRNVGRLWGASRNVKPVCRQEVKCTEDDVRGVILNWKHAPDEDRTMYRVLYETASLFTDYIQAGAE